MNIHVIPNGLDLSKWEFKDRKHGPNILYVGEISHKKGPMLLMNAFHHLLVCQYQKRWKGAKDPYHLWIAGQFKDPRFEFYVKHYIMQTKMEEYVHLQGYVKDLPALHDTMNYAILTSPWESQNLGIMEAMASGIKPLIHWFPGAETIYPKTYLWNDFTQLKFLVSESPYNSKEYRNYIEDRYSMKNMIKKIGEVMEVKK